MESTYRVVYGIAWGARHPVLALEAAADAGVTLENRLHEKIEVIHASLRAFESRGHYKVLRLVGSLICRVGLATSRLFVSLVGLLGRLSLRGPAYALQLVSTILGRSYHQMIRRPLNATLLRPFTWKLPAYIPTPENDLFTKLFHLYLKPYFDLWKQVERELQQRSFWQGFKLASQILEINWQHALQRTSLDELNSKPFDAALCNSYASLLKSCEAHFAFLHFKKRLAQENVAAFEGTGLTDATIQWLTPYLHPQNPQERELCCELLSQMSKRETLKAQILPFVSNLLRLWPQTRYARIDGTPAKPEKDAQAEAVEKAHTTICSVFEQPLNRAEAAQKLKSLEERFLMQFLNTIEKQETEHLLVALLLCKKAATANTDQIARLIDQFNAKFSAYKAFIAKWLSTETLLRQLNAQLDISGAIGELFLYLLSNISEALSNADEIDATKKIFGLLLKQCLECNCNAPVALKERLISELQGYRLNNHDAQFKLNPLSGNWPWLNEQSDPLAKEILQAARANREDQDKEF